MTYTLKARRYIEGVLRGDIPACRQIKLACQRTKDNFDRLSDPKFSYFYFEAQAERVCQIIEMLPHVKGKWAAQGKKIVLEDWQCWIVCELYGWLRKEDNKRKYRRATLIIPRKQGKSLLLAAMLVIHLLFDGEFGAECYCGASNLKQAKEIFSAAQKMLLNSPDIRELTGVEVNAASLVVADGCNWMGRGSSRHLHDDREAERIAVDDRGGLRHTEDRPLDCGGARIERFGFLNPLNRSGGQQDAVRH